MKNNENVKKAIYKIYMLIRILAIFTAIIILLINSYLIIKDFRNDQIFSRLVFSYNIIKLCVTEAFLFFLILFPYKLESISIFAFLYTGVMLYTDPLNILSIMTFFLGFLSLYFRGLLRKHKIAKGLALGLTFIFVLFSNLRYGRIFFLEDFTSKLSCTVICILIFIFIVMEGKMHRSENPVLDLSQYPELTERDKEWIELALSQEKYDTIARHYSLSPNYVKNRMRVIFKILDVPDRLGLLAAYSGWTIKK